MLARWLLGRDAGSDDVRRVATAVQRASDAFLWRQFRLVGIAAAPLAALIFSLHALRGRGDVLGKLEAAFWSALGLLMGASFACLVAQLAVRVAQRASL